MRNEDAERFKGLLLKQKQELQNILDKMKKSSRSEQDKYSPSELSNYDNHPAEIGSELFDLEHSNALLAHEGYLLKQVDKALDKIDKGKYGRCEFCGKDIDMARLEALPYAGLCIECADERARETDEYRRGRPVEEKVIDAPFGRKYLNRQEDDEDEGLDYWNDLTKYGSASSPQDMGGYEDYEDFYTNEVDEQGVVDKMDRISNEEYKRQLP